VKKPLILLIVAVVLVVPAWASDQVVKDVSLIDSRLGPENFRMSGGQDGFCFDTPTNIPCPGQVTTTLDIPCPDSTIQDLDLLVQISHTWVGDLSATLTKVGSGSATVFHQPGVPDSNFGCSGDDIDAIINDEATDPIEFECAEAVPSIQGEFIGGDPPDDTLMATWDGEELCGTWTLNVADNAGGDLGTLFQWCLIPGPPDVPDGAVPSTTDVGVIAMILLLLGSSAYFLGRRATN